MLRSLFGDPSPAYGCFYSDANLVSLHSEFAHLKVSFLLIRPREVL